MKGLGWIKKLNPLDAIAKRAGKKAVEGALEAVAEKVTPKETHMFGVNNKTNILGILTLVFQVLKIVIPMFQGQPPNIGLEDPAITSAGIGLMNSKDDNVVGAGITARKI